MSSGDCSRIFRNRTMPGSICCCRISDSACSYEAGEAGDCAAGENSKDTSSAKRIESLMKGDFTDSEYYRHPSKASVAAGEIVREDIVMSPSTISPAAEAPSQNSIFNANCTFLAPNAVVDLPKLEFEISPTGLSRFTRLKRL